MVGLETKQTKIKKNFKIKFTLAYSCYNNLISGYIVYRINNLISYYDNTDYLHWFLCLSAINNKQSC